MGYLGYIFFLVNGKDLGQIEVVQSKTILLHVYAPGISTSGLADCSFDSPIAQDEDD